MEQHRKQTARKGRFIWHLRREWPLHVFLIPGLIFLIWFYYVPMVGNVMAFQKFTVFKGWFKAKWVGLDNFRFVMSLPNFYPVLWNTLYISSLKILFNLLFPIFISLLLNEVRSTKFKRTVQTVIYMPHFLSWIIFGGIILDILGTDGIVNRLIAMMGGSSVNFLTSNKTFRSVLVVTDVWKNFGFNTNVYMSALTAIDPSLYEAAAIDGANRWQQTTHVTLPGIKSTFMVLLIMNIGHLMEAGFEIQYLMRSGLTMKYSDTIDVFALIYSFGSSRPHYAYGTAAGIFKSVVGIILLFGANRIARLLDEETLI